MEKQPSYKELLSETNHLRRVLDLERSKWLSLYDLLQDSRVKECNSIYEIHKFIEAQCATIKGEKEERAYIGITEIRSVDCEERTFQRINELQDFTDDQDKFKTIFDHAGDGILLGNLTGIIEKANPGFYSICGLEECEVINKHLRLFFSVDSLVERPLRFDLVDNGTPVIFERIMVGKNGEMIPVEMNTNRLGRNHFITIIRDLSVRKRVEQQLISVNDQLLLAKEKAEESDQLKTEFLTNMSHEIRTPMNGILGFAKMLNEPELSCDQQKLYTNIIVNSSNQLLKIIDDILEISKLETKQIQVFVKETNVNDLMMELQAFYKEKAHANNISFTVRNTLDDFQSIIYTDESKLRRILESLIDNALRYTYQGYVEIGYELKGNDLQFFVKDTGIGISQEYHEIIFDRFSQADKRLSRKYQGLGLGLSIAKKNVVLLGGEISVDSEFGQGATFCFTIPYRPCPAEKVKGLWAAKQKMNREKNMNQFNVMIVEDDRVSSLYFETLLKVKYPNVKVIHVKDGLEAVEYCQLYKDIDLVLMDLKMSRMNGFDATQKIKNLLPEVKVIIQTASASEEDRYLSKVCGGDDFISKPVKKELFYKMLKKYLVPVPITVEK
ncbi:response regulator [Marinilabiliaceae bacterium JC017]|nr:response regulator [Marinilabiliaceae bacterium JC017]